MPVCIRMRIERCRGRRRGDGCNGSSANAEAEASRETHTCCSHVRVYFFDNSRVHSLACRRREATIESGHAAAAAISFPRT